MTSHDINDNRSLLSRTAGDPSRPQSTSKRKKDSASARIILHPAGYLSAEEWIILRDPWAKARLLYPNPVCLLTTWTNNAARFSQNANCMVITWIMCADNSGGILASVNRKRFSALALQEPSAKFTLSIPTQGMESLVLNVGTCSGFEVDKFLPAGFLQAATLPLVNSDSSYPPAIENEGIVAIITCDVLNILDSVEEDHMIVLAKMTHAIVRMSHWDGKCFGGSPAILCFLGSKRFAQMQEVRLEETMGDAKADATT